MSWVRLLELPERIPLCELAKHLGLKHSTVYWWTLLPKALPVHREKVNTYEHCIVDKDVLIGWLIETNRLTSKAKDVLEEK